ncbi:HAD-superfamily subfamily IIA hydrolase, TIGR01458 [Amphritea atlantica]|uniref:Haloacid dehalogenase-like hydrolase domain-containing protein 2 n=1 Tax=Amphritea atlantica TaxID=355243 RepID=A0A1H9H8K7_9GAMM|nr:TIGR01458 family HAD-type hydrolase [Amphritea atlantica]SEQ58606.1 HAD-superfamily subfamily IIA hydrolase, TIGR01458 [Amphritea atlantica]
MLTGIQALLLDISGVIYQGSQPVEGAVEVIEKARQKGLTVRFLTNTASKSSAQIMQELRSMGVNIEPQELFTAPRAACELIDERGLRPYCILPDAIAAKFECYPPEQADAVLLGDAVDGLSYASLNQAFRLCQAGAPLIAIGMNRYYMSDEGLQLDAGPFVKALEWAARTEAQVMGKPGRAFFHRAVASTGYQAHECLMVGDDIDADVLGALDAGIPAVLVRTGKYCPEDEQKLTSGGRVIDSLAHLFD